jgi:glutamine cyclotransferase
VSGTVERPATGLVARVSAEACPLVATLLLTAAACGDDPSPAQSDDPPPVYTYEVVAVHPHDSSAFTQGLAWHEGSLYEGTGLHGQSTLREVALETGDVLRSRALPFEHFGEGVAVRGDEVVQLTWRSGVGFVYDVDTFEQERTFAYATEGWGITHDGTRFVMSDGTATLTFRDDPALEVVGTVEVSDDQGPVERLNELEWVDGEVWANVWMTDRIARIDPDDGRVTGWIDLTGLLPESERTGSEDVLNGIAYDAAAGRIFVTGKRWPRLYEIEVIRR